MKHKALMIALVTSALAGQALADGLEPLTPTDSRYKILNYDESEVYTITTRYGYQTNIVFGVHEEIQTISVGDRSLWQIIPSGSRLFIRPMEENVTTNMTILTNKRSYQFDLKSAAPGKTDGTIYVAKFVYDAPHKSTPSPAATASTPAQPSSIPFGHATAPVSSKLEQSSMHIASNTEAASPYNFNYTFSGPDELAPQQVYDDGQATYIKYSDLDHLPSTYIVDEQGQESPASYHLKDGMMVVDNVVGELALKDGNGTIKIYNEVLNPK